MERVYTGDWTDVALVNNLLEREGVDTIVIAAQESRYLRSVYVVDAADVDRAHDIIGRYLRGEPLDDPRFYRSWRCRSCNELLEGQFDVCWNCGAGKTS
jgi:hypothetical protein